jgi:hypothetical protein
MEKFKGVYIPGAMALVKCRKTGAVKEYLEQQQNPYNQVIVAELYIYNVDNHTVKAVFRIAKQLAREMLKTTPARKMVVAFNGYGSVATLPSIQIFEE